MPARNKDLHGMVPDKSRVAVLLLDVLNDLEWAGGNLILKYALPMSKNIALLTQRARAVGVPIIYVNDNYGKWRSDLKSLVDHCLLGNVRGRPMVELLRPHADDYFILKPKHSAFFSTSLDILLAYLEVQTLILTGIAGDICVLFTANDAYLRDYELFVPADCSASNNKKDNDHALQQMRQLLKADTRCSSRLNLKELKYRHTRK